MVFAIALWRRGREGTRQAWLDEAESAPQGVLRVTAPFIPEGQDPTAEAMCFTRSGATLPVRDMERADVESAIRSTVDVLGRVQRLAQAVVTASSQIFQGLHVQAECDKASAREDQASAATAAKRSARP